MESGARRLACCSCWSRWGRWRRVLGGGETVNAVAVPDKRKANEAVEMAHFMVV